MFLREKLSLFGALFLLRVLGSTNSQKYCNFSSFYPLRYPSSILIGDMVDRIDKFYSGDGTGKGTL